MAPVYAGPATPDLEQPGAGPPTELFLGNDGWSCRLEVLTRETRLARVLAAIEREEGAADPAVRSPMPGTVVSVSVSDGDTVEAGQVLLSVEAMKMEHQLVAPLDGTVHISVDGRRPGQGGPGAGHHPRSRPARRGGRSRGHGRGSRHRHGRGRLARTSRNNTIRHTQQTRHTVQTRSPTMADFELSEEYQDLSNTVREFADEVVAPVSAKHDEEHSFPYEVVTQMADMGLFGLPFPEEFGGMGGDYFALALALEQLGRVDQSVAITLEAGVSLGAMPVYRFGTDAQKEEWLPLLASGKALAGFGLTEPEAGSDAGGTKTTRPAGRRASGSSTATRSSSPTPARTSPAWSPSPPSPARRNARTAASRRKSPPSWCPPTRPGSRRRRPTTRWAGTPRTRTRSRSRTSASRRPTCWASRAAATPTSSPSWTRAGSPSPPWPSGAAQGCVDLSVKYAKERSAFGQNIGKYQAIAFKIARMQARAHTARLAYYDAAARMLAGKPFKTQAAIAKMVAGEAAMDNARDATQVFGGYGFINEFTVARHYRDSKILEVGEGTTEVQLMLIARELGL